MPRHVVCPRCRKTGLVRDDFTGNRIQCPRCWTRFVLTPEGQRLGDSEVVAIPAHPSHGDGDEPAQAVHRHRSRPTPESLPAGERTSRPMARLPRSAPTLRDLANEPVSDDTMFDVPVMEPADVGSQSGRLNGRPSIAVSFAAVLAVLVVLLLILVAVLLSRGSGGATLSPTAPGQDAGPWNGTQFPAIGEREGCGV